jgi:hypothetical protein
LGSGHDEESKEERKKRKKLEKEIARTQGPEATTIGKKRSLVELDGEGESEKKKKKRKAST